MRGRAATATELATWATPLDQRRTTRAKVLVALAESSWNRDLTRGRVDTINAYTALLRRMPTDTALSTWIGRFRSGSTRATVVQALLRSSEYAPRAK